MAIVGAVRQHEPPEDCRTYSSPRSPDSVLYEQGGPERASGHTEVGVDEPRRPLLHPFLQLLRLDQHEQPVVEHTGEPSAEEEAHAHGPSGMEDDQGRHAKNEQQVVTPVLWT